MAHLRFCIRYQTRWGECPCLRIRDDRQQTVLPMKTEDGFHWHGEWDMPPGSTLLEYDYVICEPSGTIIRMERGGTRHFDTGLRSRIALSDDWRERGIPQVMQRSAFADCIFKCAEEFRSDVKLITRPYMLLLSAMPPPDGMRWAVLGNTPEWGEWQPEKARYMQRTGIYEWGLPLTAADFNTPIEYKYLLIDGRDGQQFVWEEGENRKLHPLGLMKNEAAVKQDDTPRMHTGLWRGAGVVVPVFSLRSHHSFGIGDFGDLALLIDWAEATGMHAIQILPVNDTTSSFTWRDSYPYNGISVFALHPIYIDPSEWENTTAYQRHEAQGKSLNGLPAVDYEKVWEVKWQFLKDLYKECGERIMGSPSFKEFCREEAGWLDAYARFCCMRDRYHTADFRKWPADGLEPKKEETDLYRFTQYILDRQLRKVHQKARQNGIILKGDIPIGISRCSVPAWKDGHLFHFEGQAGAPPDAFAIKGQNWKFPTYNWEEMTHDGYAWWRKRLHHMARYFDAYRIDHVLGFFRIWEIPAEHCDGIMGHFRPALPLSVSELRQWGFYSDPERLSIPSVTEPRLKELETAAGNLRSFFQESDEGLWTLKPEWRSQQYTQSHIADCKVREALINAATEVLFLKDPDRQDSYHPRIAGQFTCRFQQLPRAEQEAYNKLYDDFFYTRHNQFWADEASKKLPSLVDNVHAADGTENNMLPCAEDLGMIPGCVKDVLKKFGILSLEIQRMPKDTSRQFSDLAANPYLSVATISTHDMAPLRLWWQTERSAAQTYWNEVLHRPGKAPSHASEELCERIVSMHLECPSMLCLLALQDWLSIDSQLRSPHPEEEQINEPSNPDQYWRYRMHICIEELITATAFNEKLRGLITRNGR